MDEKKGKKLESGERPTKKTSAECGPSNSAALSSGEGPSEVEFPRSFIKA